MFAPSRLNRDVVQYGAVDASAATSPLGFSFHGITPQSLSRRQFLGITGSTLGLALPASNAIHWLAEQPIQTLDATLSGGKLCLLAGDRTLWTIDAAQFGGSPRLSLTKAASRFVIELQQAFYPGTRIPADIYCVLRMIGGTWTMDLSLAIGGLKVKTLLLPWLTGESTATGRVKQNEFRFALALGETLLVRCAARLAFSPDWSLLLEGTQCAALVSRKFQLEADAVFLSLPRPSSKPLALATDSGGELDPAAKTSLLTLHRGGQQWNIVPRLGPGMRGLRAEANAFEKFHIESAETEGKFRHQVQLATGEGPGAGLTYTPARHLKSGNGEPLRLPLTKPRYALLREHGHDEVLLLAQARLEPQWVAVHGHGLKIGGETPSMLEAVSSGGKLRSFQCEVPLTASFAGLEGSTTSPVLLDDGSKLALAPAVQLVKATAAGHKKAHASKPAHGHTPAPHAALLKIKGKHCKLLQNFDGRRVQVIREQDLLALDFSFTHVVLCIDKKGARRLYTKDPDAPAATPWHPVPVPPPSFVAVEFPPQHIVEQAFYESNDPFGAGIKTSDPLPALPIKSRMSPRSRLVFKIPPSNAGIEYTLKSLLNWNRWELSVVPNALPDGEFPASIPGPAPRVPSQTETAIEGPYRLTLSPNRYAAWVHVTDPPVTAHPVVWTELWHTRLSVKFSGDAVDDENRYFRTLRAVYTPDTGPEFENPDLSHPPDNDGDLRLPSKPYDRSQLVQLSSRFGLKGNGLTRDDYVPRPLSVELFMMSSLGAWMDFKGNWKYPTGLGFDLEEWKQLSIMGRDQSVTVVKGGHLFPFGHRATLTTVTERKFSRPTKGGPIKAFTRQRSFISVKVPLLTYGNSGLTGTFPEETPENPPPHAGEEYAVDRKFPFQKVEIKTLITPNLDKPEENAVLPSVGGGDLCWPRVNGRDFLFKLHCTDWAGKESDTSVALIWMSDALLPGDEASAVTADLQMGEISDEYAKYQERIQGTPFNGQKIAFAPSDTPGDTTYEARSIHFEAFPASRRSIYPPPTPTPVTSTPAATPGPHAANLLRDEVAPADTACPADCEDNTQAVISPPVVPFMRKASVKVPAVSELMASAAPGASQHVDINWADEYLMHGFSGTAGNPGEVFAKLAKNLSFSLPEIRSPGLIKPDFDITGLSRRFGTAGGDLGQLALGNFDPSGYFKGIEVKILGALDLMKIIKAITIGSGGSEMEKVPHVKSRILYDAKGFPEGQESRVDWYPELQNVQLSIIEFNRLPGNRASLQIILVTKLRNAGAEPAVTQQVIGKLENFQVVIAQAIAVNFLSLALNSGTGRKTDVEVKLGDVQFRGGLAFLSELQESLSGNLFGSGAYIRLEGLSVAAGITVALPNLSFGIFSLRNLRLAAQLNIPLSGKDPLRLRFAFGERDNHFLVGVTILAGGGFIAICFGADGIESVEMAIEFGGMLAIDVFVARGEVHAFAGIYVLYYKDERGTVVSGYLRIGGSLSILGIISVSVEFMMALEYRSAEGSVCGTATLTVSISILFFSKDVTFSVSRCFAGSSPSRNQLRRENQSRAAELIRPAGLALASQPPTHAHDGHQPMLMGPPAPKAPGRHNTARSAAVDATVNDHLKPVNFISKADWDELCDAFADW